MILILIIYIYWKYYTTLYNIINAIKNIILFYVKLIIILKNNNNK